MVSGERLMVNGSLLIMNGSFSPSLNTTLLIASDPKMINHHM